MVAPLPSLLLCIAAGCMAGAAHAKTGPAKVTVLTPKPSVADFRLQGAARHDPQAIVRAMEAAREDEGAKPPPKPERFSTRIRFTPENSPIDGSFNPVGLKLRLRMAL